jgi:CysZ protein
MVELVCTLTGMEKKEKHALSAGLPEKHPLSAGLPDRDESAMRQFIGGLRIPVRSARFLMKNRGLWPLAAIPAALSFAVFAVAATTLVFQSNALLVYLWAKPEDWLVVFWWAMRILMIPVVLLITYFLTLMVSAVVASPANDRLAMRIEEIIVGNPRGSDDSLNAIVSGAARGALQAAANLGILVVLMTPIFLLNVIPGVGSLIASVLGALVASFFLALDYTDWTLEREMYGWKDKWRGIWTNRHLALGFGLGTSLLMWIPVVNFLSMPIAVVGGTSLALEIKARSERKR